MIKQKSICIILLISFILSLLPIEHVKVLAESGEEISQDGTPSQPILNKWKKIYTMSDICLGILDDDSLWQWCTNTNSNVIAAEKMHTNPVKVLDKVDEVSIGDEGNILALTKDKKLWSWCLCNHTNTADYTCTLSSEPTIIMNGVINISAGSSHICLFVKDNGSLWGWGNNSDKQLGEARSTVSHSAPVEIIKEGVKSAICGWTFSFAIKDDDSLWAWGKNEDGQLGNGTTEDITEPQKIKDMDNVIKLVTKYNSCFALKSDKSLWAWGNNSYGQLGDGQKNRENPTPAKIMKDVSDVTAASFTTYAIALDENNNKALYAWGSNTHGELGDQTTTTKPSPIKVQGIGSVSKISAYDSHILALSENGSLYSWGSNISSQIQKNGEYVSKPVNMANDVIDISTDKNTSSYITTAGILQKGQINSEKVSEPKIVAVQPYISNVAIENNNILVRFSGALLASVIDTDFSVTRITNGQEKPSISCSIQSFDKNTNTAILHPLEDIPADTDKTVSYLVSYKNNMSVKTTNEIIIKPTAAPASPSSSTSVIVPISLSTASPAASPTPYATSGSQVTSDPSESKPGSIPHDYNERISSFKKEVIEVMDRFSRVEDPYDEKGDIITQMAEDLIEEVSGIKIDAVGNEMEINKKLLLSQSTQALKAKGDIYKFLEEKTVEVNRKIRTTINIDIALHANALDINVSNDVIPLMEKEIDVKVSTIAGNIILYHENIENQLNNDLTLNIARKKAQTDPKIKSDILTLLFKSKNGNTTSQLNQKVGIQLPYGDGNPESSTIFNKSNGRITNLGGHQNAKRKTLLTSSKRSGDYYVVENKKTFKDIENMDSEAKRAIEFLASKGVIGGRNEYSFDPGAKINRSEFTSLIVKDLGFNDEIASVNFKDVLKTAWYYNAVAVACKKSLINGYEDNTFRGSAIINKQEIVKICSASLITVRGFRLPSNEDKELPFKDMDKIPKWASKYIALGNKEGLIVKRSDGCFNGTLPCTRGDAAVIMYRLYLKLG